MLVKSQNYRNSNTQLPAHRSVCDLKDNHLYKSNASTITPTVQQLQQQIWLFKEKAHQSFMQVIKIQSLHQQEMNELRLQLEERQNQIIELKQKISKIQHKNQQLELKNRQLQYQNNILQKNTKIHTCWMENDELSIDNIEIIQGVQQSRLDDSVLNAFRQLTQGKDQKILIKNIIQHATILNISQNIQFNLIRQSSNVIIKEAEYLSRQWSNIIQKLALLKKQMQQLQSKNRINKISYENLQKQNLIMSDQLKKISFQKIKLQKKLNQTQRLLKTQEDKLHKLQVQSSKNIKQIKQQQYKSQISKSPQSSNIQQKILDSLRRTQGNKISTSSGPKWLAVRLNRNG